MQDDESLSLRIFGVEASENVVKTVLNIFNASPNPECLPSELGDILRNHCKLKQKMPERFSFQLQDKQRKK